MSRLCTRLIGSLYSADGILFVIDHTAMYVMELLKDSYYNTYQTWKYIQQ